MSEINLYPEMNKEIINLLRLCPNEIELYAADLIEQQQKEIEQLRAKQVVRCGECRFWEEQFDTVGICKYGNINLDHCNNGYCSYGERKGEEECLRNKYL